MLTVEPELFFEKLMTHTPASVTLPQKSPFQIRQSINSQASQTMDG